VFCTFYFVNLGLMVLGFFCHFIGLRVKLFRPVFQDVGLVRLKPLVSPINQEAKQKLHCVSKNITDIFDRNLKTNDQILIILSTNISDTTCYQMTIQVFFTSPNECFCTT